MDIGASLLRLEARWPECYPALRRLHADEPLAKNGDKWVVGITFDKYSKSNILITGKNPEDTMDAAVKHLEQTYGNSPRKDNQG